MRLIKILALLIFAVSASASSRKKLLHISHLGCLKNRYKLQASARWRYNDANYCAKQCDSGGAAYAALRGDDCYCWHSDEKPQIEDFTAEEACDLPCPGWSRNKCGSKNSWVWSLYQLRGEPLDIFGTRTTAVTATSTQKKKGNGYGAPTGSLLPTPGSHDDL
ncbi:hypothetical protein BJX64DRAFT_253882 [Aspergillus heterothallicus]